MNRVRENEIALQANYFREDIGLSPEEPIGIDFIERVKAIGYSYFEDSFDGEFNGFSQTKDGNFIIGYNLSHNHNLGFKRFTIAHEIGHHILHQELLKDGDMHRSITHSNSSEECEREADHFAISLLAPATAYRNKARFKPANFDIVKELSEYFGISLLASAIHFVKISKDLAFSLVHCKGTAIEYDIRSNLFYEECAKFHKTLKGNQSPFGRPPLQEGILKDNYLKDWYPHSPTNSKITEAFCPLNYDDRYLVLIEPDSLAIEEDDIC